MALVSPSAGLAPKVKVEQPPGFNMHSLHLYAPLSMSAMAAAYYGYDKKKLPVAALAPLLVLAAMLDWKASQYRALVKDNEVDIDGYTNSQPSLTERAKIVSIHGLSTGSHKRSLEAHKLAMTSSPFVPGLLASKLLADGLQPLKLGTAEEKPIVVGTIRMGFGHHRIAYSASSWALGGGSQTVFHDFLAIDSPEANLIKDADALYSRGSRLASELGGVVEKIWGSLTKSGDATSLRITNQLAECLRPLMLDLPKDTPIIATHSLVGLAAVACGFKNVINLVIDNYAQWFVVVPGAVNLVQGPTNFHQLSKMGIPEADIRLAGHWCPKDMVDNIDADCTTRIQRRAQKKPLRLLIPVGGAGAQRKFVTKFLLALKDEIKAGHVQVMLNAGDHKHMKTAFLETLAKMGITESAAAATEGMQIVDSIDGVRDFCTRLRDGAEPTKGVTLFAFDDYFPAVATTDLLARVADVLCAKPSELAFYPVPKLNIRRVGDHEAYSALRSSEVGDGSLEVREADEAVSWVQMMRERNSILDTMNKCIMANAKQGAYDGCKVAVELAQQMAGYSSSGQQAKAKPAAARAKSPADTLD